MSEMLTEEERAEISSRCEGHPPCCSDIHRLIASDRAREERLNAAAFMVSEFWARAFLAEERVKHLDRLRPYVKHKRSCKAFCFPLEAPNCDCGLGDDWEREVFGE